MPRATSFFETLERDMSYGLRTLARDWRFTTAAVLILGLGIGANTAIFSLVDAVLFRHALLPEPDRLVDIYQRSANPDGQDANSYPAYLDIAEYVDVFAGTMATSVPHEATYQHDGALRSAVVENATATYLAVLGLQPSLGRWFTAEEDRRGAPIVTVLGYHTWRQRFGADPAMIGRTIRIDGVPVTIVGVGPAGHNGTLNIGLVTDFWLPIASLERFGMAAALQRRPGESMFLVKGRLRNGVGVAQAQAAMDILGRRLAADYPNDDPGRGIKVIASKDIWIHPQLDAPINATAFIILAIVGLVFAIACSNLATLLLVRGAARARDISIRLAIGATRRQLVRQLLTESLLLAGAGGAAGCVLAWWGIRWFRTVDLPIVIDISIDGRVLAYAIAVSVLTGIACGLAPALSATNVDVLPALRGDTAAAGSGPGRLTLKNGLIVFQVSMSVLLLGGASLFLQWADAERTKPIGYAVDGVAMLETDSRFSTLSAPQTMAMYQEVRRRIAAIPGVESVALTRGLPMRMTGQRLVVDGAAGGSSRRAGMFWAGPEFFETLQIPLIDGRTFDASDRAGTPRVAVINETMAREYFGSVNAVGRRFRMESPADSWMEVVGVVRDTGADLLDPVPHVFYRSFTQSDTLPTTVVARTSQAAGTLLPAMQRELRAVDATLPVISARTMAQDRQDALRGSQAIAMALGGLGMLGVVLASIGLYAVVAFVVARRSREIGIRMAIGARGPHVIWNVTRGVAGLVGAGTALGLALTIAATLALRAAYAPAPGVSLYRPAIDPVALLAIAFFMGLVGVAAAFVPARRAALTDPLAALRQD
ncbi:MAG TPA: ABC transporter permease [Vicinamibacterales bacterium]|nr:ABC transporter permease [Vicinamibacterales bacterium]